MLIGFTGKSRITGVFPKTILLIIGKIINDQTPTYSETDENCYSAHLIILLYPRMKQRPMKQEECRSAGVEGDAYVFSLDHDEANTLLCEFLGWQN